MNCGLMVLKYHQLSWSFRQWREISIELFEMSLQQLLGMIALYFSRWRAAAHTWRFTHTTQCIRKWRTNTECSWAKTLAYDRLPAPPILSRVAIEAYANTLLKIVQRSPPDGVYPCPTPCLYSCSKYNDNILCSICKASTE